MNRTVARKKRTTRLATSKRRQLQDPRRESALCLKRRDPNDHIDLERLACAVRDSFEVQIVREEGVWTLPYGVVRVPNKWHRKLVELCRTTPRQRRYDFREIARIADPRTAFSERNRNSVLHVPFDLRFPVKTQLAQLSPLLNRLRDAAYALAETTPPDNPSPYLWRDIYITLLRWSAERTWSAIGAEVFPNDDPSSRMGKAKRASGRLVAALANYDRSYFLEDPATD